jgi:hypothetical protein
MLSVSVDKFNSIVVDVDTRIDDGNHIVFMTVAGEKKSGVITKICGSKKERKFQIMPDGLENEEIWSVFSIEKIVSVEAV